MSRDPKNPSTWGPVGQRNGSDSDTSHERAPGTIRGLGLGNSPLEWDDDNTLRDDPSDGPYSTVETLRKPERRYAIPNGASAPPISEEATTVQPLQPATSMLEWEDEELLTEVYKNKRDSLPPLAPPPRSKPVAHRPLPPATAPPSKPASRPPPPSYSPPAAYVAPQSTWNHVQTLRPLPPPSTPPPSRPVAPPRRPSLPPPSRPAPPPPPMSRRSEPPPPLSRAVARGLGATLPLVVPPPPRMPSIPPDPPPTRPERNVFPPAPEPPPTRPERNVYTPPPRPDPVSFEPVLWEPPHSPAPPVVAFEPPAPPRAPAVQPQYGYVQTPAAPMYSSAPPPGLVNAGPHTAAHAGAMHSSMPPPGQPYPYPSIPPPAPLPMVPMSHQTFAPPRAVAPTAPPGASKLSLGIAVFSLVLTMGMAILLFLPRKGQLRIELGSEGGTRVERAEIFVDGKKECDTAPCRIANVPAGPKTIRVIAPDFAVPDLVTEVVESGKEKVVIIPLRPAQGQTTTTIKVAGGGQAGGKVLVDGVDKGPAPVDIKGITPGVHKVRFEGGPRFEPLEQMVDVAAGKVREIGPIKLKVLQGRVTVELRTSGARVLVIRKESGRIQKILNGPWPMSFDADAQGLKLVASAAGRQSLEQDLVFPDGQAELALRVDLDSSSSSAAVVRGPSTPQQAPVRSDAPTKPVPVAAAEKDDEPEAAAPSGTGSLNINSIPPSKVLLDGRPLGGTPKTDVSVSAGTHTVTFVHPDFGKKSVSVEVKAGQTATAAVRFNKK